MLSLEDKIKEQYAERGGMEHLYNSDYSRLADEERIKKVKQILQNYNLSNSSILEIGAGQGDNVQMLLDLGFESKKIFLNELLPERAQRIKVNHPDIVLFEGDALTINFNQTFDCVFQSTVFTSILEDTDRIKLANKMWNLLNPGGIILWYDFVYNNPSNLNVKKVSIQETTDLFPLAKRREIVKVTLAPPIGRRVGKMYRLFNLPFLRSHILAVFQK